MRIVCIGYKVFQYGLDNAGDSATPRHKHLEPNWQTSKNIIDLAQSTGYPADVQRCLSTTIY